MHNIGIVTFDGLKIRAEDIDAPIPKEWEVQTYDPNATKTFELVLIIETQSNQVGEICNQILRLKKDYAPLLWVWSSIENKMNRSIYLKLGADGIATPALSCEEWLLTIENALSRRKIYRKQDNLISIEEVHSKRLNLNTKDRSLLFDGKDKIHLTNLEFKIVALLFQNIGELVTYKELYQSIYEENEVPDSHLYRVTNIVFHIRKKILSKGKGDPIKNIRSKGYILTI
ncbi:winged helix-turn-helix domain-containing protein [Enterococcus faecalis]|uniref:winged helix-turn-helix domain-containing protein n=1 Tax=Enterococcus faecalis TaxID=1351 RepID=UPI00254280B0|nr:winged helix-turn-helix domain-containing protein [Enterococcus faecalis]MDK4396681.1 winged helix-turn-helix domain-containing protein [Enterococcus faecalis]MDK4415197.1 winged helix-turn-helix domain-containing protein [Enterococcus faecalis]